MNDQRKFTDEKPIKTLSLPVLVSHIDDSGDFWFQEVNEGRFKIIQIVDSFYFRVEAIVRN